MESRGSRWTLALLVSLGAVIVATVIGITVGSRPLSLMRAFHGLSPDREILVDLRLPRALLALWTGGALSLSGVLFQALLRNPLATPYTLGVAEGASLGAVIAICLGWNSGGRITAVSLAACVGAVVVLLILVAISSEGGRLSSIGLLLAGVTINSMCGAAILFLSNIVGFLKSFAVTRWLVGSLEAPDYFTLLWLSLVLTPICLVVFWYAREWNTLTIGETWAATRGLSPARLLLIGCVAGSVLTGLVTSLTGPIAFVGLIIPHALRLWVGADHRILLPCSFLMGAAFVALCDVLARTVWAPVEIPVGVITALLGGPFFIWMLRSRRGGVRA